MLAKAAHQRRGAVHGGELRQTAGAATGKGRAMSRWQKLVDNLLTDLGTEMPGAADFRVSVDHKIWEVEQKTSKEVPMAPYETEVRRLHGFQRELIEPTGEK